MDQEQKPRERSFISELVPDWRPTREQVLRAIRIIVALVVALIVVGFLGVVLWIMLAKYIDPQTATERKDIVQSFALAVAGVVGSLSALAAVGNFYISRRNLQQQWELEELRAQEDALPAYLDQMIQLLFDEDRPLHRAAAGPEVSLLARVRTLTVLPRLDGDRKQSVVQFLYESDLITRGHVVVDLSGADLREANLSGTNLSNADLHEANLSNADLVHANLNGANLRRANLIDAYLGGTDLSNADLRGADLGGAYLSGADLSYAKLPYANLRRANLVEARLRYADLSEADLSEVNLSGAGELTELKLRGANLSHADLSFTDLRRALGLTEEQLEHAETLEGATMPNGKKYEEWLKSKGRGEDGQNSGTS